MSDLSWRGLTLKHDPPSAGNTGQWDFWRFGESGFVHVTAYRRTGEVGTRAEYGAQIVWLENDDQYFPGGVADDDTLLGALEKALAAAVPPAAMYGAAIRRMGVEQ